MIGVMIRCDEPGCVEQILLAARYANKSSLVRFARFSGWQVGKEKHYCPQHRKAHPVKKS